MMRALSVFTHIYNEMPPAGPTRAATSGGPPETLREPSGGLPGLAGVGAYLAPGLRCVRGRTSIYIPAQYGSC